MKPLWIDIMFRDKFHRKFKYKLDTMFNTWTEDLVNYTLKEFPYLNRRKEFELWFNLPNMREPTRIIVRPDKKNNN